MAARHGIILFAHGSRDEAWKRPIEAVADRIRERSPGTVVACAYLELTAPALPEVVDAMAADGVASIDIVPLFLGMGRHAREDLPELAARASAAHPGCTIALKPPVGENPRTIDLLAEIALTAEPS